MPIGRIDANKGTELQAEEPNRSKKDMDAAKAKEIQMQRQLQVMEAFLKLLTGNLITFSNVQQGSVHKENQTFEVNLSTSMTTELSWMCATNLILLQSPYAKEKIGGESNPWNDLIKT